LTITDEGDLTLDLIGGFDLGISHESLSGRGFSSSGETRRVPVLLGDTEAKKVTLLDCYSKRAEAINMSGGPPRFHKLGAERALIGVHLEHPAEQIFKCAYVRLENLLTFLHQSALTHEFGSHGGQQTATMQAPDSDNVLVNGVGIEAGQRTGMFHFERQRDSAAVIGRAYAMLTITTPTSVSCTGFDELMKAFMDLLTFASNQASGVISCTLVLETSRVIEPHRDGWPNEMPIEVELITRRIHTASPEEPPQDDHNWLFTCATKPYAELVAAWLPLHQRAVAACSVLFGLKYLDPGFLHTEALMIAVCAEAMHKSLYQDGVTPPHRKAQEVADMALAATNDRKEAAEITKRLTDVNYRNRLLNLAARPSQPIVDSIIPSATKLADQMANVRNGLAHEATHVGDPVDLFTVTQRTTYLLYLVLMSELGIEETGQRAAIQNQRFR
jgi:hypothetical protein